MDRRVKERLVGASILVVLIVLIVPELLSGPAPPAAVPTLPVRAPEPNRNVTVDLRTSKAPAHEWIDAAPASAAEPSAAPPPVTPPVTPSPGAPPAGAPEPAVTAADQPPTPVPATPAAPQSSASSAAPSSTAPLSTPLEMPPPPLTSTAVRPAGAHHWAVQLGSFASRDNADKLSGQVKAQGFAVYVLSGGSGAAARYRVRVGPMADRNAASQALAKLKALGHPASIVAPGS